jgi:HK97 gp10 family phage protein
MIRSFVERFKEQVLYPAVARKMEDAGRAWVAAATALAPVDTGRLRASIGFAYNRETRTLKLHADEPYAAFVEFGTYRTRAQPFMRPAVAAVARIWGSAVELHVPTLAPRYHAGTLRHADGRLRGARLRVGHPGPRRR